MIAKESSSGCQCSVLLELEYFDSPRFLVVDPMHNLFLGTAKHHLKRVWIEKGLISDAMFEQIQGRVDAITVHLESVGSHTRLDEDSHPSLPTNGKTGSTISYC